MNKIQFSKVHAKLLDFTGRIINVATLLSVIPVILEDQSEAFLSYDTDDGTYRLPKSGIYLMLIFEKPCCCKSLSSRDLFTTLRRSTIKKATYYRSAIGQEFVVEVLS